MIWTLAKKELRGYFNSAVALIFLTTFLVVTHDPRIAQGCDRVVEMIDGRIRAR